MVFFVCGQAAYKARLSDVTVDSFSCYDEVLQLYRSSEHSEEKARILSMMAAELTKSTFKTLNNPLISGFP